MGDLFFSGRFPFIDPNSGGDVKGFIKNVTSVRGMVDENTKIIPGHGALSTKKDLDAFHAMLIECSGLVKRAIASGKSLDDIKAAGMPARYKDWGAAFISEERWIDILYAGLAN